MLSIALMIALVAPQAPACLDTLPTDVEKAVGEWKLARKSDYVPAIRNYTPPDYLKGQEKSVSCSLYAVDLNEDGLTDYSAILTNPETNGFRFQIFVNNGGGRFKSVTVRNYRKSALSARDGTIYISMSVKPAGTAGPLDPRQRKVYQAQPAVEICDGSLKNPDGTPQAVDDFSSLCYCVIGHYFVGKRLMEVTACD